MAGTGCNPMRKLFALSALVLALGAAPAGAQPPAAPAAPAQPPATSGPLPPAGSAPLIRAIELAFPTQGNVSVIEPQTYLYYIQTKPSRPTDGVWVPYTEATEQTLLEDFRRLWNTNFLDNLSVEVKDSPYPNGVMGKHIIFNMEERQRVKIVDYVGSKALDQSKVEEKLKEIGVQIRLDSFIDPGIIRRVQGVVRDLLAEKGYEFAEVKPEIKELPGGPKLVHVTFNMIEGPKVKLREIDFAGNKAVSDRALRRHMKENKQKGMFSFILGGGTYKEAKFEEDADRVLEYYRNKGYIAARVGQPELKYLEDSSDGRTRWMQLRVPITEGNRYRVGDFTFDGNTVIKSEGLRPLFKMKAGEWYSEKKVRKGLEKAREVYGSGGYFEFTGYPDLKPRDLPPADTTEKPGDAAAAPQDGTEPGDNAAQAAPAGGGTAQAPAGKQAAPKPIVDITMRLQEGKQYFVNRITFTGNTTTRDNVIRREMRLYENGIFNTEALKFSVKRLNQLGYFKPLEGQKDIQVEKTPGADNKVDVTLKFEEQNRNQLTFGAGVSQYEGVFGQLMFQTSNFLGRGEALTVSLQAGSIAQNYQLSFTEPFLFDRPITGGADIYKRDFRYIGQFTQKSEGGNLVFGFPVGNFTRMFANYSYERVRVTELNAIYNDPLVLAANPFLRDSLLIGLNGVRTISKITPSIVLNTVDNPIFPSSGRRYTASIDLAGIGGNTNFYKPRVEGVWYLQQSRRTSIGLRGQFEFLAPFSGDAARLPIFEKLYLGGGYSIRGFDIRSVGPRDEATGLVLGGNKSLLFNAEYVISIAGPVRLVLFYDAGQVRDVGQNFGWKEPIIKTVVPPTLTPLIGTAVGGLVNTEPVTRFQDGEASAFKTSTGAEIRFFMPVLNVPFRLIFAFNPQRYGVRNNNLELEKRFRFRFDVGTTF
jgi:outer membrane protein insertion porin family